ncbi:MAG: hypothetical protein JW850_02570, partial [Thermoflexales bacterium]|nr:hypothetical protein [Thermoflexales bacterium]
MRTIRRVSYTLNQGKWDALVELVKRYAGEKDTHLIFLGQAEHFASHHSHRARRDELVHGGYASPHGLQARAWKSALKDAHETVSKWWSALAANLRPRVASQAYWSDAQKHYAYWLLKSPQRLAQLVGGRAPEPEHFEIAQAERRQVRNYLRRVIRGREAGKRSGLSRVKLARSAAFDAQMYEVFTHGGAQYIKVMSLVPGRRIVIPLTGNTPIRGTIRLILDVGRQRVEVHYAVEVKSSQSLVGEACGLDAGVSEVFTDECGERYGTEFGRLLDRASKRLTDKGRKRNRLHQIAKKAAERGDHRKARNILRFNLGRKKLNETRRRLRAEMARQINTATNQVLRKRQPCVIITERLDIRGKAASKRLSRQVSLWTRGMLKERVEFKASAGGSSR